MRTSRFKLSGAALIAAAMLAMSVLAYGFTIVAARLMIPAEFGALTALMSIILVANVASLGLQAAVARQLAVAPQHRSAIVARTSRVSLAVAAVVSSIVAISTVIATPLLRLDSYLPVLLCAAMIFPLTMMGAQAGVAQGTDRWARLATIYFAQGVGRIGGGVAGLLIEPSVTAAMAGLAVGAWVPVLAGGGLLRWADSDTESTRPSIPDVLASSSALLAYFALSSSDAIIARAVLDPHESGLYASGLILAKSALFLPQFVSVVLFPALARDSGRQTRTFATGSVVLLGALVVTATAIFPSLALILVGGNDYAEVADYLWMFALSGSLLAVVHVLVFDALARQSRGVTLVQWGALGVIVLASFILDLDVPLLASVMIATSTSVIVVLWFLPSKTPARSTEVPNPVS